MESYVQGKPEETAEAERIIIASWGSVCQHTVIGRHGIEGSGNYGKSQD